jgi:SpoVK/Ycf46/Vps4 family AAA+-type ATPase
VSPDHQFENSAEELQTDVFDVAFAEAPSAVLFDDFSWLGSHSFDGDDRVLKRNLTRASKSGGIVVVATDDDLSDLSRTIARPGRFDVLCPLDIPDADRRRYLLDTFLDSVDRAKDLSDEARADIVERTHGFTPADLEAAVRRAIARLHGTDATLDHSSLSVSINRLDRDLALDKNESSTILGDSSFDSYYAYDDNLVSEDDGTDPIEFSWGPEDDDGDDEPHIAIQRAGDVPEVSYDDIGGLEDAKRVLREAVEWPTEHPELSEQMGLDHAQGIPLHGPPGNGKTMLAKAIASETDSQFISVKGPEVMDKYVGESQKFVGRLFDAARELAPSVVFIDEIDSITDERGGDGVEVTTDRVVNQLLLELDGLGDCSEGVVIGATNRRDIIDEAIRRPGRLGKEVHVPPPDEAAAREIFEVHLRDRPVEEGVSLDWLVEQSGEDVSGAEIAAICEEGARSAMRRQLDGSDDGTDKNSVRIGKSDFESAFAANRDDTESGDVTAFQ